MSSSPTIARPRPRRSPITLIFALPPLLVLILVLLGAYRRSAGPRGTHRGAAQRAGRAPPRRRSAAFSSRRRRRDRVRPRRRGQRRRPGARRLRGVRRASPRSTGPGGRPRPRAGRAQALSPPCAGSGATPQAPVERGLELAERPGGAERQGDGAEHRPRTLPDPGACACSRMLRIAPRRGAH